MCLPSERKASEMVPQLQKSLVKRAPKRKRFPWTRGIIVSLGLMAILAFIIVTLLILWSQGMTQGINTLTIISIVIGFAISVLSLLVSFLQWHHPKPTDRSEPDLHVIPQMLSLNQIECPLPPDSSPHPLQQSVKSEENLFVPRSHPIDWGEAPHTEQLYGREEELAQVKGWLVDDRCRLVAILGMGGIGKTSLAATLVDQVHEHYDYVFWRSLINAPPLKRILQECIQFVSGQQQTVLPEEADSQISLLIDFLRARRCLLVLDNVESILQGGSQTGRYREGYEGYGKLLQRIGENRHQSCLLITSREKPKEVALLEGETTTIRSYHLLGLQPLAGREILNNKGLEGTTQNWEELITHYGGNPLALKLVAQAIREIFGGDIPAFLKNGEVFFSDVHDVLDQQMKRLSPLEEEIVYWLAIEREAIGLDNLQENIVHPVSKGDFQEALRSLRRRHLIETSILGFSLQNVIMQYLTDRLVNRVCEEIKTETLILFEQHALLLAQAKEYIRESQCRLILQPLLQCLLAIFGKEALEQQFQKILGSLRARDDHQPSYAAGNLLNLLIQMGCALRGYDFSHLEVQQAYLQGVDLPEVNFAYADLATSVFTDTFGSILSVAFSPHGDVLATGTVTGEIRLWHAARGAPLQTFQGHSDYVRSVAFSPDGKTLASGGDDQIVRLWEVNSGKLLHTLSGHSHWVRSVAFSSDGKTLASGSHDQTVRLWEVNSGKLLHTLHSHTNEITSVAFSPDGKTLASGSHDQTVRLWEVNSGKLLHTLHGHASAITSVAFSPDGKNLASGSHDQTVHMWEVNSRKLLHTLHGHDHWVRSVAFSSDGKNLASGGDDQTVRLWEVNSGKLLHTLHGHTSTISSVAFSSDGKTLASGSNDQTVCLWEMNSGKLLHVLRSYTNAVFSVAFSPDSRTIASGSHDQTVRLWEVSSGKLLYTLHGHSDWVRSVAFSPDGKTLASCSYDQTVRLWEVSSGKLLHTLHGHASAITSVAFSSDGRTLASGSHDQTVRLWEVSSGKLLHTLHGHVNAVWSVAFSPDSHILASGSDDQTVRLWEMNSGQCFNTLHGHIGTINSVTFSPDSHILASGSDDQTVRLWKTKSGQCFNILHDHASSVWSVAFSPDGKTLASGSNDQTVCLWEVSSGKLLHTLHGHSHWVISLAFSPDGKTLVSGSHNGVMNLWNRQTGARLCTLKSDRPYERMNITHVKGLTEVQKATLRLLGAIEERGIENE